ncbi:MAG: hypothetical protein P4L85_19735 [Paludisphaera borealis]|uniref:hypothetical protein n=1 Tax=Paludisphaera borealis TaxID=1387353 RepID=UPI00283BDDC3|nr:hypothetical protein [Paludisphaera borealis]MDR3621592.1 hypothetical protein [Paludisphaera borealis]
MSNATPKFVRRPTAPSSARDMAMLRLAPIDAFAVPRLHVEPRQADGGLRVLDRPTGTYVLVYTPSYTSQFRAGHRSGRWYVRSLTHVGSQPQSLDFASARAAVDAVGRGTWGLQAAKSAPTPPTHKLLVIWLEAGALASAG